jgi:hypothetical protein
MMHQPTRRPPAATSADAAADLRLVRFPFSGDSGMLRIAGFCFILTSLLGLSAGCGSSGGGGSFEAAPDNGERYPLIEVGDILRNRMLDTTQPARNPAEIARYENAGPTAFSKIQKGELVVIWGANPQPGASDKVLAYEKQTPQSGGFVLMQDGTTVKKLTAAEFQSAPKAGGAATPGAAGK